MVWITTGPIKTTVVNGQAFWNRPLEYRKGYAVSQMVPALVPHFSIALLIEAFLPYPTAVWCPFEARQQSPQNGHVKYHRQLMPPMWVSHHISFSYVCSHIEPYTTSRVHTANAQLSSSPTWASILANSRDYCCMSRYPAYRALPLLDGLRFHMTLAHQPID